MIRSIGVVTPVSDGFGKAKGAPNSTPAISGTTSLPCRASVRQADKWFAFKEWRRATSFTDTPATSVSATIRAFASSDQYRLAAGAAKSSTNPTASIGRSRWTPNDTSRANLHREPHRSLRIQQEGGVGTTLTVYLARRLEDERIRAAVDTELRARDKQGIGLVLQAGELQGTCLAANVLAKLVDHIVPDATEFAVDVTSLAVAYRRNRSLAQGGSAVEFNKSGDSAGILRVPGRGTIDIVGAHRVAVIDRLVRAYPAPMKTEDMIAGFGGQSPSSIFGKPLWDKLKAGFLRSPKRGQWEIAV